VRMAETDFETKVAVVVRDDLAGWQRLNVCAFLSSGVTAATGPVAIGTVRERSSAVCAGTSSVTPGS
jgi:hypothetical protein